MQRVIAIGLDAAEWWLIEDLMDKGRMPNLAALRARGTSARLTNVREYRSELPWTLFWTGKSAADNGYWSTVQFDPSTYEVFEIGAYEGSRPFWQNAAPGKVVTFDLPHIPIFWDRDDVQVTGWGAHSPQYPRASKPRGLLKSIDAEFGPHPSMERDHEPMWFDAGLLQSLHDALVEGAQQRSAIVERLAQKKDWQLLITVMSEPHSIGHHGWHGVMSNHPASGAPGAAEAGAHVRSVYESMDKAVGRICAAAPDAAVVVFAAHGMQANTNELTSLLMLPELLHRAHFGKPSLSAAPPWWDKRSLRLPAGRHSWGMDVVRLHGEGMQERFRQAVRLALPHPVFEAKHALASKLGRAVPERPRFDEVGIHPESLDSPQEISSRRISCDWQPPCWWKQHWAEMPWFALPTYSDGHIRINLEGRERNGVVPQGDYQRTCNELATMLKGLRNPLNGHAAVEDVAFVRSDDRNDPFGPSADVVVLWKEPAFVVEHDDFGRIGPLPFRRTGEHSSNGFALLAGPNITHSDAGNRAAADVAPTLLSLLNETIPSDLAGVSLLG